MMSLLCRFIWIVQSLDKVVDMPVIVNDSDCIVDNGSGVLLLVCWFCISRCITPGFNLDAPTKSSLVFA